MSTPPATPCKNNISKLHKLSESEEDNNNLQLKQDDCQQARTFVAWYKHMADNERPNLGLYLSDDATLEWFGRTIKTKKKISIFFKYDMECSRHDFTTIENIDKIQTRNETGKRQPSTVLNCPLEKVDSEKQPLCRKRPLRLSFGSPELIDSADQNRKTIKKGKRVKVNNVELKDMEPNLNEFGDRKREFNNDISSEICSKGDGSLEKMKRKSALVTPPFQELGQGDCIPSTSSEKSHEALNAQLPQLAVECNGYLKFIRMRNNQPMDALKWERKCKVQISYSVDPLNVGEYIIWALCYSDESKCRRNLLPAFEEAAKEQG